MHDQPAGSVALDRSDVDRPSDAFGLLELLTAQGES